MDKFITNGVAGDSKTAILRQATITANQFRCKVCTGFGHVEAVCPFKKWLDKYADREYDKNNWGQWKYETYWKAKTVEQRRKETARAAKASGRTYKGVWKNKYKS